MKNISLEFIWILQKNTFHVKIRYEYGSRIQFVDDTDVFFPEMCALLARKKRNLWEGWSPC